MKRRAPGTLRPTMLSCLMEFAGSRVRRKVEHDVQQGRSPGSMAGCGRQSGAPSPGGNRKSASSEPHDFLRFGSKICHIGLGSTREGMFDWLPDSGFNLAHGTFKFDETELQLAWMGPSAKLLFPAALIRIASIQAIGFYLPDQGQYLLRL